MVGHARTGTPMKIPEKWITLAWVALGASLIVVPIIYILAWVIFGPPWPGCVLETDFCQGDRIRGDFG